MTAEPHAAVDAANEPDGMVQQELEEAFNVGGGSTASCSLLQARRCSVCCDCMVVTLRTCAMLEGLLPYLLPTTVCFVGEDMQQGNAQTTCESAHRKQPEEELAYPNGKTEMMRVVDNKLRRPETPR